MCHVSTTKPEAAVQSFIGVCCISLAKADAIAALKQCELRILGKCWGNGEVRRRCMLCQVEVQVCEGMKSWLHFNVLLSQVGALWSKASNCSNAPQCHRAVFFQKRPPCAVKTRGAVPQIMGHPVNLSCGLFSCRTKRSQVRLHQWSVMPLRPTAAFLQRIQVSAAERKELGLLCCSFLPP